jgi:hypothetical protein
MHFVGTAFACAFAGAVMVYNVTSLHAAPLPTNVAAMKSMVADSSIQVRWGWGYWAGVVEVWLVRGNGPRNRQPSPSHAIGLTTGTTRGAGTIGKAAPPDTGRPGS